MLHPRWSAVILYVAGLAGFIFLGRRLARRLSAGAPAPGFGDVKSFALFVVGLAGVYVLVVNPFSVFFFVPLLFWFLVGGKGGWGKPADILFFALGRLVVYALLYVFGFVVLRYNFTFLWYLMNMFSVGMISFPTATAVAAIVGAGLSMIVRPPHKA